MPDLNTRHFGVISCPEESILYFPEGLPAFEHARRFVAIEHPADSPVIFLQSTEEPALCFLTLPVEVVEPDYRLAAAFEDLKVLGLDGSRQPVIGSDVACLAIVSAAGNCQPSVNLLAPIIVNLKTRVAVQAVRLDREYSHQHPVAAAGGACS